jgi:hypothetical protein
MKYTFTLTALLSLTTALPQTLTTGTQSPGTCKFVFNHAMCKDHSKTKEYEYKLSLDSPLYTPHPLLPQSIQQVSHCYDFIDKSSTDTSKDKDATPTFGEHGRTILESDQRPLYTFGPGTGHMWMTEDACKDNFRAIAVFEKPGCQGSYMWYNLPTIGEMSKDADKSIVKDDKEDWCVAPFLPLFRKTLGSFQMWVAPPEDKAYGLGTPI